MKEEEEDTNFILKASQEVGEIREYLAGKTKSIDGQLLNLNEKFENENKQLKKKLAEVHEQIKLIKENETSVSDSFLRNQQNKFSQKTKSSHDTNSKVLNETVESHKAYYEDKIIEIFEEMELLKKEYLGIIEKMSEENPKSEKDMPKDSEKLKNIAVRIGVAGDSKSVEEMKRDL